MFSHSILPRDNPSDRQFVGDLTNLCKRHKISCGTPQDITHLGADLVSNDSFRADLFALCTAISHMAEADLSPEQLLILVVRAFGGSETSIRDVTIDLPEDATSAFVHGYEKWSQHELDPDPGLSWNADRDQDLLQSQPPPTLFYTGAFRSAPDPREKPDGSPASHTTNGALLRRHIPADTPLESLTLSELRMYLEDIENRVSQLEPRLERIAPQRLLPLEQIQHIEQTKAADTPEISPPPVSEEIKAANPLEVSPIAVIEQAKPAETPEASLTAATQQSGLAIIPETIAPAAQSEPALDTTTVSLPVVPLQNATAAHVPAPSTNAADLRRLRIVNAVLAFLLILVCGSAAIFGYRYFRSKPASLADATHQSPLPIEQPQPQPEPGPADQPATALNHTPASPAASPIPTAIHQSGDTATGNAVDKHPSPASSTQPVPPPAPVIRLAPQAGAKQPELTPTQASQAPASPHAPLPTTTQPTSDNNAPSKTKLSLSDAQLDRKIAELETPPPPATHPLVPTPAPPNPAVTSTPASIPHPAAAANGPIAVPSAMMMTYARFTPKPTYPNFRRLRDDNTIDVEVTISKDGKVTSARSLTGLPELRGAAVRAVEDWTFSPYILNGKPTAVVTTFKFVFKAH